MGKVRASWASRSREKVYEELDHPADLFLAIKGRDLPALFENALFALFDQMANLAEFAPREEITIEVREPSAPEALRTLLAEALYRFETEGFVAVAAEVTTDAPAVCGWQDEADDPVCSGEPVNVRVIAKLRGESAGARRHALLTEVKAVTYHRLSAGQAADGTWQATVLFDI